MRNPSRIYPLLNKIGEIWVNHPDLEFGELIANILPFEANFLSSVKDEEFEKFVDEYSKKKTQNF